VHSVTCLGGCCGQMSGPAQDPKAATAPSLPQSPKGPRTVKLSRSPVGPGVVRVTGGGISAQGSSASFSATPGQSASFSANPPPPLNLYAHAWQGAAITSGRGSETARGGCEVAGAAQPSGRRHTIVRATSVTSLQQQPTGGSGVAPSSPPKARHPPVRSPRAEEVGKAVGSPQGGPQQVSAEEAAQPVTMQDLQRYLNMEHSVWTSGLHELRAKYDRELEALTERVDQRISEASAESVEKIDGIFNSLEALMERVDQKINQVVAESAEKFVGVSRSKEVHELVNGLSRKTGERLAELEVRLEAGLRDACRMGTSACEARLNNVEERLEGGHRSVQDLDSRVQWLAEHLARVGEQAEGRSNRADFEQVKQELREVYMSVAAVCGEVEGLKARCVEQAGGLQELQGCLVAQVPMASQELRGCLAAQEQMRGDLDLLREQQLQARADLEALSQQQQGGGINLSRIEPGPEIQLQVMWGRVEELRMQQSQAARDVEAVRGENSGAMEGLRAALQSQVASEVQALESRLVPGIRALQEQHNHSGGMESLRLLQDQCAVHGKDIEVLRGQHRELAGALQDLKGELISNMDALQALSGQLASGVHGEAGEVQPMEEPQPTQGQQGSCDEFEVIKAQVMEEVRLLRGQVCRSSQDIEAVKTRFADELEILRTRGRRSATELEDLRRVQEGLAQTLEGRLACGVDTMRRQLATELEPLRRQQAEHAGELEVVRGQLSGRLEVQMCH